MKDSDIPKAAMQPAFEQQARDTARIRRRKAFQAKLVLVTATAISSSYATYTAMRYVATGEFEPISLVVLAVFGVVLGDRWRVTEGSSNASVA